MTYELLNRFTNKILFTGTHAECDRFAEAYKCGPDACYRRIKSAFRRIGA